MKKSLILLVTVLLLMSCSAAGIPYDGKISDRLEASVSEIEAGQTVEPDRFEEYDWVYIIPPYTGGEALDSLEVDEQSKKYIYKQASSYENYFLVTSKDGKAVSYAILDKNFSTEGGKLLKYKGSDKLLVRKEETGGRPFLFLPK
ncbi:hypothetical protein [Paenibacillus sp. UNC499MF]|uniref:hypothetical protein n=1 Tax=Paenibacillus sp. UNC499MF TaxID=1502751 RepID=UPI00089FF3AF|nr:hypothetical protein [Paenibacillus sp. UNC499MF]SEG64042.1 hypothetical protein SAMN02799616_03950 [Paenibacillus sp. UNC499MF]